MTDAQRFADLGKPRRIWAVAALHADAPRLDTIHRAIAARFQPGDRLIYLGNMIGRGGAVVATLDLLLAFRRWLMAWPGVKADDLVYLRGQQEVMWQKLLQLQFAPNPGEVLDWMLGQGLAATLAAYGGEVEQGRIAIRGGATAITRWTQGLRQAMYAHPGHENLFDVLKRAAYVRPPETRPSETRPPETSPPESLPPGQTGGMLFVSAGVDPDRPFGHQGDSFWWGSGGFARLDQPFDGFARVVRGYSPPSRTPVPDSEHRISLDDGCGHGGPLIGAGFTPDGQIFERFHI